MSGVRLIAWYLGHNRRDFLLALLCVAAETSLELAIPMLMAQVIDEGIMARDLDVVFADGGLMVVCALAALGLGLLYARFSARAAMGLGANLREAEYAHLQTYSFANLDDFEASSLVTRLTTDVTVIQNAVVSGTRPMVRGPVSLLVGIAYAALMSPDLALVFCVTTPVIAVAMLAVVRHVAPLYRLLQRSMDRLNDTLQEDLSGIRVIKAYVREDHMAGRFETVNMDLASTATRTFRTAVLNMPILQGAMYATCVAIMLIGGRDVREYDLAVLRDAVAVVLQNTTLFSGTIRENLAWGDPDADDGRMLEACRLACADEFLDRIGGLDGVLGQGGAGVSGGQRQRLCIARALLKHPRILILDDSTSAVDMATDVRIRANLTGLGGITTIVIAQRVASVMDADMIVVLDDGRIEGVGTHAELLDGNPIYREIYESQVGSGVHGGPDAAGTRGGTSDVRGEGE